MLGGNDQNMPLDTVECYDPGTDEWSDVAPMSQPRHGLAAVALPSLGLIMAIGGWDGDNLLSSTEIYDISTGKWSATGQMNEARMYHAAAGL